MEGIMTGIMYEIPSDLSIRKVIITADCVDGAKPTILRDAANPRKALGA
jgi:ATP-dependent protease Clp ATPase subunit